MIKHRVCIGSWAGAKQDVLEQIGVELGKDGNYPVKEMTMDEIFALARKIIDIGDIGVQLTPYIYGDHLDYILWVDSAKGRFRQR